MMDEREQLADDICVTHLGCRIIIVPHASGGLTFEDYKLLKAAVALLDPSNDLVWNALWRPK